MAINPTGPRIGGQASGQAGNRIQRGQGAQPRPDALLEGPRERPQRRSILRTAIDDTEIGRQLARLGRLLAADEIDMDAPRGSYLNFLV
ncbi:MULTISPECIES: hypothetical protein [Oceanibaculum]|uniref:Uncharacterized protein n=2 Tax=Oceanibaculum indicum TaxID=526216 RepID=K2JQ15_9PROT|nr:MULTISPECIES: hypothetical protein [Oceanibaculum]EKE77363.1 hypothetical protein P24_06262 [Oceanibaculum indicum P24]MCH2395340.1 hypothetical protein [Oceanibaculum sp.]RKQ68132.1 hypothetical protein BCL74_3451 [Oceanibaculum indicum]